MTGRSHARPPRAHGRRGVLALIAGALILVSQPAAVGKASQTVQGGDASHASHQNVVAAATATLIDTRFTTGQSGPWPVGHLALNGGIASLSHGSYVLSNQNGYSAMAFPRGIKSLGDGTISAAFHLPTTGRVGVVARYTNIRDGIDYDDCWLDEIGRVGCDIWANGMPSMLLASRALGLNRGVNHTLALSLQGSVFSVSIDGRWVYRGRSSHAQSDGGWGLYVIGKFSQGVVKGSFSRATIANSGATPAHTPSPTRTPKPTATPRSTSTPSPPPIPTHRAQSAWISRISGTAQNLWDINCPSASVCVAVGGDGTILTSKDGGVTWTNLPSGITQTIDSVSCPSISKCIVVGHGGAVLTSKDGGVTWNSQPSNLSLSLNGVSCPSVSVCVGVSYDIIVTSADGGLSWTSQPSGTTQKLIGVSCLSASDCIAVGFGGTILTSKDGGVTWTSRPSGSTTVLERVSCATVSTCVAVGASTVLRSVDGGLTWTSPIAVNTEYLTGVSCSSAGACVVVGHGDIILSSSDGGVTWTSQTLDTTSKLLRVSCATASTCVAVGDHGTILTSGTGG